MKLHSIETGFFKLDGGAMFGVVPKSIWQKTNPADENNMCTWAIRSLLIENGNQLILVDTGIGNKQDEKFLSHYYLHGKDSLEKSLTKTGFAKEDITDVFLTHLHFDHCGGAIEKKKNRLIPAFKNANYWSNQQHWDWAVKPNAREKASFLKENILPVQESGQLGFIPIQNNIVFCENFSVLFAYGHTQAMMLPKLAYKNKILIFTADLLPSTSHIPLPYIMSYDMFPMKTLIEKQDFLTEAANNEYILFMQHDPLIECCTVQKTEKGIRLKDVFKLVDI